MRKLYRPTWTRQTGRRAASFVSTSTFPAGSHTIEAVKTLIACGCNAMAKSSDDRPRRHKKSPGGRRAEACGSGLPRELNLHLLDRRDRLLVICDGLGDALLEARSRRLLASQRNVVPDRSHPHLQGMA